MKKKLFGMLLAATLILAQTATVFAAGSKEAPEAGVEAASVPIGDTQAAFTELEGSALPEEKKEEVKDQIALANAGDLSAIPVAPTGDVKAVTKVFDVTQAGDVSVKVNIPSKVTAMYALHFSITRGLWEKLPAAIGNDGWVTFTLADVSPVILVAEVDVDRSYNDDDGDDEAAPAGAASAPAATAAGSVATSPKTGVASDWALWMVAAVVLLGISGAAFRKTRA